MTHLLSVLNIFSSFQQIIKSIEYKGQINAFLIVNLSYWLLLKHITVKFCQTFLLFCKLITHYSLHFFKCIFFHVYFPVNKFWHWEKFICTFILMKPKINDVIRKLLEQKRWNSFGDPFRSANDWRIVLFKEMAVNLANNWPSWIKDKFRCVFI